jgi:hypothetical protein
MLTKSVSTRPHSNVEQIFIEYRFEGAQKLLACPRRPRVSVRPWSHGQRGIGHSPCTNELTICMNMNV